jgi:mannose-6-phosphate isomerase-like protein (cupin superfamily)
VVVRAQDRTTPKEIVATGYRYEPLVTGWHGQRVDAFILTFPLQNRADVLTAHDGEELLYVLQGQIAFRLGSQDIPLKAGDCIYFRSEIPHMGKNVGTVDARVLMVTSPGRGPGRELGWWNATPVPGRSPRRAKTSRVGQKRR